MQAQDDLDNLLNLSLGFAQQELARRGEFFPYSAAIRTDGETELVATGVDDDDDHPEPAAVLAACFAGWLRCATGYARAQWSATFL